VPLPAFDSSGEGSVEVRGSMRRISQPLSRHASGEVKDWVSRNVPRVRLHRSVQCRTSCVGLRGVHPAA
jgi:hypothetical protein